MYSVKLRRITTEKGQVYFEGFLPEVFGKKGQRLRVTGFDDENQEIGIIPFSDKPPTKDGSFYLLIQSPK